MDSVRPPVSELRRTAPMATTTSDTIGATSASRVGSAARRRSCACFNAAWTGGGATLAVPSRLASRPTERMSGANVVQAPARKSLTGGCSNPSPDPPPAQPVASAPNRATTARACRFRGGQATCRVTGASFTSLTLAPAARHERSRRRRARFVLARWAARSPTATHHLPKVVVVCSGGWKCYGRISSRRSLWQVEGLTRQPDEGPHRVSINPYPETAARCGRSDGNGGHGRGLTAPEPAGLQRIQPPRGAVHHLRPAGGQHRRLCVHQPGQRQDGHAGGQLLT